MINDKIVLITGATDGIGKQTAFDLARKGAKIIVHGRNNKKAEQIASIVSRETGNDHIWGFGADLSTLHQVRDLAEKIGNRFDKIDVLINNAGVFHPERAESVDGIEATFAVNHLGPFLLTESLLDVLKKNAPSRIINVASALHYRAKTDFLAGGPALERKENYSGIQAYNDSKLCNVIYTMDLLRKLQSQNISVYAFHPGVVDTGLVREYPGFVKFAWSMLSKSAKKAAIPLVELASLPDPGPSGTYFHGKKRKNPLPAANDPASAEALRRISEQLLS